MSFGEVIENVGKGVDAAGVALIVLGLLYAAVSGILRRGGHRDVFSTVRQRMGRAILLGLEVLVAADIIRTVAISPTFRSAGVLAIIVAIRTFLSFTLEVELTGRWPWQKPRAS